MTKSRMVDSKDAPIKPLAPRDMTKITEARKVKGLLLESGTFQDLSHEQRLEYFEGVENEWKKNYNKMKSKGITGTSTLTRG